jgi:hypothetical protein
MAGRFDFGVSFSDEQLREGFEYNYTRVDPTPILEGDAPPVLVELGRASGTDVAG